VNPEAAVGIGKQKHRQDPPHTKKWRHTRRKLRLKTNVEKKKRKKNYPAKQPLQLGGRPQLTLKFEGSEKA